MNQKMFVSVAFNKWTKRWAYDVSNTVDLAKSSLNDEDLVENTKRIFELELPEVQQDKKSEVPVIKVQG